MKVAIARPTSALRNTSFEGQLQCYDYLASEFDFDVDVLCRADNELSTDATEVSLIDVSQTPIEKAKHLFREGVTKGLKMNNNINMPEFSQVYTILNDGDYDVVEVPDPRLYKTAHFAYRAIRDKNSRLVLTASASKDLPSPIPQSYTQEVTDAASAIVLVSPRTNKCFVDMGLIDEDDPRVGYTGHPIDTDAFSPTSYGEEETVQFLSVGQIEPRKGYRDIYQAFSQASELINFEWHIVGSGELEDWIIQESKKDGVRESIIFHGQVDHDMIPSFYNKADVFILHSKETESWEEYFGVVYAEAMSSGLPVIGSQSGAIPWVVRDRQDGILPREGDIEGLSDAITDLSRHPEKRKRLGQNGRRNVLDRFTIESVARKFKNAWGK